jgi:hypothetical protein
MNYRHSKFEYLTYAFAVIFALSGILLINLEALTLYIAGASILSFILVLNKINNSGFFNPLSLFLATALPYILSSPIDILFFKNTANLEPNAIAMQSMFGLVFILFVIIFSGLRINNPYEIIFKNKLKHDPANMVIVAIGLLNVLLVAILFSLEIGALTRSEIYLNKPVAYDLFKIFSQCAIIFFLWQSLFVYKTKFIKLNSNFE